MNLVILASARSNSNTLDAVKKLCPVPEGDYELVDLQTKKIAHYNYDGQYSENDDFLDITKKMEKAEIIVFATPVYWYAMSGLMKVFFDRFTQLLYTHKSIGKAFKGKKTYLISSGSDPALPEGFEVPFQRTSKYFDMEYVTAFYLSVR